MRLRPLTPALLLAVTLAGCTSSSEPAEVTSVALSSAAVTLDAVGATAPLTATVRDQRGKAMNGVTVAWATNAPGVATVSAAGVVTSVSNGSATITATVDGITAQASVTVAQVPIAPAVVSGNFQQATVGTALALPLEVRVVDRLGSPMAGRQVTFAVASGGGSLSSTGGASGANGIVSTTWTLGTSTSQSQQVAASVQGVPAIATISAVALAGPAAAMAIAPGNTADGQSGTLNQPVAVRPAVIVTDVHGNGVGGVSVTFAVTAGGGSVTGGTVVTGASGVATVGSWTLGSTIGVNTLTASVGSLTPVIFTANGVTDPCQPAGATTLTLGVTRNSTLSSTDCPGPNGIEFEWYRFDLAATTSIILEMNSTQLDAYLQLYDFATQTLIEENDDIQTGVITNSRIARSLAAGSYLVRARTWDSTTSGNYSIVVRTALLGVPASVQVVQGDGQVSAPGAAVPIAPRLRVLDEGGLGVSGVQVTWATVTGVGSATGTATTTDANGFAQVGSWTLAAGANVLSASVNGFATPAIFSASGKSGTGGFDISLRFATIPSPSQLQTFSDAAARWEAILTGDLTAVPLNVAAGTCNSASAINESIDDVVIVVRLEPIDGVGNVLGSAGPCFTRSGTFTPAQQAFLPLLGTMRFDTADIANLEAAGSFGAVILHEMGHVLGIGTIWRNKGLLLNPSLPSSSGADTHFTGAAAVAAFNTVGGATYTGGGKVPVENSQGGAGTRDSHWREAVLQNELMTGFLNAGSNPLSVLTIQSLQDLGYTVSTATADAFFVVTSLRAAGSEERGLEMKDDVRTGPVYEVERDGRIKGMPQPPAAPRVNKPRKR